jgi:hypothetical protein
MRDTDRNAVRPHKHESATWTRLTPHDDDHPTHEHYWEDPAIDLIMVAGRGLVLGLAVIGLTLAVKALSA